MGSYVELNSIYIDGRIGLYGIKYNLRAPSFRWFVSSAYVVM